MARDPNAMMVRPMSRNPVAVMMVMVMIRVPRACAHGDSDSAGLGGGKGEGAADQGDEKGDVRFHVSETRIEGAPVFGCG